MPIKLTKIVSEQSGPFSRHNNKVDIVIPSYIGYSDMSRTCIVLNLQLTNDAGTLIGLYDAGFQTGLDAASLIKNCTISSTNVGLVETQTASNVLTQNMKQMTEDFEDREAQRLYGSETYLVSNNPDPQQIGFIIKKNRVGDVYSKAETY